MIGQDGTYSISPAPVRQIYSSTITISKTVYDPDAADCNESSAVTRFHSTSPYNSLSRSQAKRHSAHDQNHTSPYSTLDSQKMKSSSCYGTQQRNYHSSPFSTLDRDQTGIATNQSLVSGNLSELDSLLDDLSVSARVYSSLPREHKRTAAGTFTFGLFSCRSVN